MHANSLVKQLLDVKGAIVNDIFISKDEIVVDVKLARSKLACRKFKTKYRYDIRTVNSRWRHLDMGIRRTWISCALRRLKCPNHGVITESVPFG
ncbi:hypothetical protein AXFE_01550 [Acidithrix ferrooxidans]|uniref:Uncharacterized protein n=1 Tax=Acidithrix ferrooxidans TaxID=1280514 RepID=A0A0D8HPB5_9ACTN|nr:hypothetical protein AXFE_01550 [Acidithrix ferrooxidans]